METQVEEKNGNLKAPAVISLAFRVVPDKGGMYCAQMLLILDDTIMERRTGVATTLGHAMAMADELMDGWAFNEIETKPEEYFRAVML